MKKKLIIVLLLVVVAISSSSITYILLKDSIKEDTLGISLKKNKGTFNNRLSMMLETGSNTGQYQSTTTDAWPTTG